MATFVFSNDVDMVYVQFLVGMLFLCSFIEASSKVMDLYILVKELYMVSSECVLFLLRMYHVCSILTVNLVLFL